MDIEEIGRKLVSLCREGRNREATYLPDDEKHHLREVAVYTVADGKITREEFFYAL